VSAVLKTNRDLAPRDDRGGGRRSFPAAPGRDKKPGPSSLKAIPSAATPRRRILIVDDHPIAREGLKRIVSAQKDMKVEGEAANSAEALALVRGADWDVVVLDLAMPGRSGLDVLKDLKREKPGLPVLVLSVHPEDQLALNVLKAGASGYLTKDAAPEQLIEAIRRLVGGGKYISATLAETIAFGMTLDSARPLSETLSDREYQVLCLIATGKSVTEIAKEFSVSVKTVSTLRHRLLSKLKLRNTAELIRFAIERNLSSLI
jgi:two-component system invasion response regulator UvrY